MTAPFDDEHASAVDLGAGPEERFARREAMRAAIAVFVELPPLQRSCVILKDVLGHSVEEIASVLATTVPAVKAALHRGRARLVEVQQAVHGPNGGAKATSPEIARYAALFNARDWDGVRAMLADDVRLDVVTRSQRTGRRDVSSYFSNYRATDDWHLFPRGLTAARAWPCSADRPTRRHRTWSC